MSGPGHYVEATDSSATIMRGVAAALRDEWMIPQKWPATLAALTGLANHLPVSARLRLIDYFVRTLGVSPEAASQVSANGLAQWAVDLYETDGQSQSYDAVVVGAPSGGVGHLAALLGAPFLSEHFLTPYRYRGDPDDSETYEAFGATLAEKILEKNPDLLVVNHYDPIHDRFLVPYINYIRMKLLNLPTPYADFIHRRLRPGGTLLFADCGYSWRQYRIGRRHYFQVGGLGGVPDTDYARSVPFPWLRQRESEWGTLPTFRRSVEAFAAEHGYRFLALNGSHPTDFSRVAFYASYQALLDQDQEPAGVLVECFTLTSPTGALRAGLLPLWLPFNCTDSLNFLKAMVSDFPHGKSVLLAPAPAFSPSPDVATASDWINACGASNEVNWLGTNPSAFPVDLAGLFRFLPTLQAWCNSLEARPRPRFSLADLEALMSRIALTQPDDADLTDPGDAVPSTPRHNT